MASINTVLPGSILPSRSARSIMAFAARSLTLHAGFMYSTLMAKNKISYYKIKKELTNFCVQALCYFVKVNQWSVANHVNGILANS